MTQFTDQQLKIAKLIYQDDQNFGYKKRSWDELPYHKHLTYLGKAAAFMRVAKKLIKKNQS